MQKGNQHGSCHYDNLQNWHAMTSHENPLFDRPYSHLTILERKRSLDGLVQMQCAPCDVQMFVLNWKHRHWYRLRQFIFSWFLTRASLAIKHARINIIYVKKVKVKICWWFKISVSLIIWICPVGQFFCKSWLPKPRSCCPQAIRQPNCRSLHWWVCLRSPQDSLLFLKMPVTWIVSVRIHVS